LCLGHRHYPGGLDRLYLLIITSYNPVTLTFDLPIEQQPSPNTWWVGTRNFYFEAY
jgi:hypothetical protein